MFEFIQDLKKAESSKQSWSIISTITIPNGSKVN